MKVLSAHGTPLRIPKPSSLLHQEEDPPQVQQELRVPGGVEVAGHHVQEGAADEALSLRGDLGRQAPQEGQGQAPQSVIS